MAAKSEFFTEIDFIIEANPDDHQKPDTVVIWDDEKLKSAFKEIEIELQKIRGGISEYVPRAIDPGKFGFPAENAIKIFLLAPNDRGFEGVKQIAKQDWGARAANHFIALLKVAREVKKNE